MDPVRVSAKAVVVEDNKLLALHMLDDEGDWYLLPGGGHEIGETLGETLQRECREEIGATVEPGPVLWLRDYQERKHEYRHLRPEFHQLEVMFRCELLERPNLDVRGDDGQIGIVWIPLDEIEQWRFYPKTLRPHLAAGLPDSGAIYLGDVN